MRRGDEVSISSSRGKEEATKKGEDALPEKDGCFFFFPQQHLSRSLSRARTPLSRSSANAGTRFRRRSRRSCARQSVARGRRQAWPRRNLRHQKSNERRSDSSCRRHRRRQLCSLHPSSLVSLSLLAPSPPHLTRSRSLFLCTREQNGPALRAWRGKRPPPGRPWSFGKRVFVEGEEEGGGRRRRKRVRRPKAKRARESRNFPRKKKRGGRRLEEEGLLLL